MAHLTQIDRNPAGGLSASGRAKYNAEGAHLRPGVLRVKSAEDMRRKGSFLRRFYGRSSLPPLTLPSGKPSRFALAAHAWGEKPPENAFEAGKLAALGTQLLSKYRSTKTKRTR